MMEQDWRDTTFIIIKRIIFVSIPLLICGKYHYVYQSLY